jgi:predicted ester cyclase
VIAGDRAAAPLRYSAHHRGELLGVPGTGRPISYAGAAFVTAERGLPTEAWVLGDLDTLRRLLDGRSADPGHQNVDVVSEQPDLP